MSSLIIGYWAIFETVVPDLWTVAVNYGPPELAQRVNLAKQDSPDAKITKHWKDRLQHSPSRKYAGSLIESGRVSFRMLDKSFTGAELRSRARHAKSLKTIQTFTRSRLTEMPLFTTPAESIRISSSKLKRLTICEGNSTKTNC